MDLKEKINLNITNSISAVFQNTIREGHNKTSINEFVDVLSNFPNMSYQNQILIWKQCPTSQMIAGKEAILASGLEITQDMKNIVLLIPSFTLEQKGKIKEENGKPLVDKVSKGYIYEIEPQYSTDYKVCPVYDLTNIKGFQNRTHDRKNILNKIKFITQCTIREAKAGELEQSQRCAIDQHKNICTFLVDSIEPEDVFLSNIISLYIDYEQIDTENDDFHKILSMLLKLSVFRYFDLPTQINSNMVSILLEDKDEVFKKDLLIELSQKNSQIIMDLTNYYLTFDEIAIANNLIRTNDYADMAITFFIVKERIQDKFLKQEMDFFQEKLYLLKEGYLEMINEKIKDKKLYTYPDFIIEFEKDK